jgi:hypothetical protein
MTAISWVYYQSDLFEDDPAAKPLNPFAGMYSARQSFMPNPVDPAGRLENELDANAWAARVRAGIPHKQLDLLIDVDARDAAAEARVDAEVEALRIHGTWHAPAPTVPPETEPRETASPQARIIGYGIVVILAALIWAYAPNPYIFYAAATGLTLVFRCIQTGLGDH